VFVFNGIRLLGGEEKAIGVNKTFDQAHQLTFPVHKSQFRRGSSMNFFVGQKSYCRASSMPFWKEEGVFV
jgi:hypothetical protein